jgi:hypothetical protein
MRVAVQGKWPGIYPGIVNLLTTVERSGFCPRLLSCLDGREQNAKNVTNKLPLLSVLGGRSNFLIMTPK